MLLYVIIGTLSALVASTLAAPACDPARVNATAEKCLKENGLSSEHADAFIPFHNWMLKLSGERINSSQLRQIETGGHANFTVIDQDDPEIFKEMEFKKQCDFRRHFANASKCIADELDDCVPEEDHMNASVKVWDRICDDENFKFDCVGTTLSKQADLLDCLRGRFDISYILSSKTMDDIVCEFARSGIDCINQKVKECDEYTGQMISEFSKQSHLKHCYVD